MPKHLWYEHWSFERPKRLGRLEVARGPELGHWLFRAYVEDRRTAEAILRRWRRDFPDQVVCILLDGEPVEDELHARTRRRRERAQREAAYFERLADEAHSESKAVDEIRYRSLASQFRRTYSP
jgi:hypothetical protein